MGKLLLPVTARPCGVGSPGLGQLTEGYGTGSPSFFDLNQTGRTRRNCLDI